MKKFIFTLLFSTLVFSSPSYAGWTKVVKKNEDGDTYYVDFDRIRKHDGYVYYWVLGDLLKPFDGALSLEAYHQGDCKLFREMGLSMSVYKQPMGNGAPFSTFELPEEWNYATPTSAREIILKSVCSY